MITVKLNEVLRERRVTGNELAARIGRSGVAVSHLRTGRAKAVRLDMLEGICRELHCQPGDILEYTENEEGG